MGNIKKARKKYTTPSHPWKRDRIDAEKILSHDYSLKNKKEIWKLSSLLTKYRNNVKKLVTRSDNQGEIEKAHLIKKVKDYGLLPDSADMDNVLELTIKDMMERRLQTIVFRKGLARSMGQARQFIVHRHIKINGKLVTVPSYLVHKNEENAISFVENSTLASVDHPERIVLPPKKEKPRREKKPLRQMRRK